MLQWNKCKLEVKAYGIKRIVVCFAVVKVRWGRDKTSNRFRVTVTVILVTYLHPLSSLLTLLLHSSHARNEDELGTCNPEQFISLAFLKERTLCSHPLTGFSKSTVVQWVSPFSSVFWDIPASRQLKLSQVSGLHWAANSLEHLV